jgi:hypothetical protein
MMLFASRLCIVTACTKAVLRCAALWIGPRVGDSVGGLSSHCAAASYGLRLQAVLRRVLLRMRC